MDTPSLRRPIASGKCASGVNPRLLNAAQWRVVIEQRRDLDDELRRLTMREHEPRR